GLLRTHRDRRRGPLPRSGAASDLDPAALRPVPARARRLSRDLLRDAERRLRDQRRERLVQPGRTVDHRGDRSGRRRERQVAPPIAVLPPSSCRGDRMTAADLLFTGGPVFTADSARSWATAVAVRD